MQQTDTPVYPRDVTMSARVSAVELAELALWFKSQGVTHMNRSSIVGDAVTVLVNALVKNGLLRRTIQTKQEAQETLLKLGIRISFNKKVARTLAPEIVMADVQETIPVLKASEL